MDEFKEFSRQFLENERLVDEMPKNVCIPTGEKPKFVQYDTPIAIQELPNHEVNIGDFIKEKYGL